ncbi:hypothetical protein RBSWK_02432 [Rhodopirellula baltica SWK14]|uniref:Uncharacterized protein n=1 Tax=Rhodopirellula baltica SWK14 TaxID=993516 RepID=L7CI86_RHOBT|nr:hypothetical protein RBSWK_02432 [Rhodopirellula baltica SWK14]
MSHLSRNEVWGEVERRRSGVREGEGWAWKTDCLYQSKTIKKTPTTTAPIGRRKTAN